MKKIVCTNDINAFNYWQSQGVECVLYSKPVDGCLNIWFAKTPNCSICGNRYNKQRIESGEMKREFEELKELVSTPNTIVITGVTLFGGKLHRELYPDSVVDVPHQRIHTSTLGEVVYGHYVCLYGAELKPVTTKPQKRVYVEYGEQGKKQDQIYYNTFYQKASKEGRRKKRAIPQWALYSQLLKQVIQNG